MTARKIAVAVLLCGLAVYYAVNWGIGKFRARNEEPPPPTLPEPDRIEHARFETTASNEGAGADAEPWRTAFASRDIPVGAHVSVGEFGEDAATLSVRQRGDVVAAELVVVAHRDSLGPRTVAAFIVDAEDEFALDDVTLFVRLPDAES